MDLQAFADSLGQASRMTRSEYHLTLGKLIDALEEANDDMVVRFEDGLHPGAFDSYRGYYSDLMISAREAPSKVVDFRESAKACVDKTFEGYKGGDFVMGLDTPLWRAEYGSSGPAIISINYNGDGLILVEKEID